jgi:two-component system uhpT operon response regulator UhpA
MHIRIALVDDHTLVREGFRGIIQLEDDMEIAYECDTFEKAKVFLLTSPDIDLFIVDISLGADTGFPLIELANRQNIKCIAVSMHSKEPYISEAMQAGANGYISKGAPVSELLAGIRAVLDDKTYYSKDVEGHLRTSVKPNPFTALTSREMGVCRSVIDGTKIKRIANQLNISPKTVYVHKANAYKKLGISSTQELFQLAKKNGVNGLL